jgi:pimeloyl-ACP methyl ester carboxylesterase
VPALEKRSITIHGHEVAYRFGGPEVVDGAPVLLLIHGMAGSSATWRDVGPALAQVFPSFVRDAGDAVRRKLGAFGVRAPHVEEEWRGYASLTDPQTRQAFVKTLRAVIDLSGQSVSAHDRLYLAELLPTLIVWGEKDKIIPVGHAYDAHDAMPGSELVVFEHSGHFPHVEEPRRFAEVLLDFLRRNPPVQLDPADWQERLVGGRPAA